MTVLSHFSCVQPFETPWTEIHGISQARILEWVAFSFSKNTPGRDTGVGCHFLNPLQYSCLGNPMDRGAWWATFHGVTESDMTECLTVSDNGDSVKEENRPIPWMIIQNTVNKSRVNSSLF